MLTFPPTFSFLLNSMSSVLINFPLLKLLILPNSHLLHNSTGVVSFSDYIWIISVHKWRNILQLCMFSFRLPSKLQVLPDFLRLDWRYIDYTMVQTLGDGSEPSFTVALSERAPSQVEEQLYLSVCWVLISPFDHFMGFWNIEIGGKRTFDLAKLLKQIFHNLLGPIHLSLLGNVA